jgi:hypothetical protein
MVQLQVSSDPIRFSFSLSSDELPIGVHCAPARDISASCGGIIPSLSWAIVTDSDETRNLILGLRFNRSVGVPHPHLGIHSLSDKTIRDNPSLVSKGPLMEKKLRSKLRVATC